MSFGLGGPIRQGFMFQGKPTWCHYHLRNGAGNRQNGNTLPFFCEVTASVATFVNTSVDFYECFVIKEGIRTPMFKQMYSGSVLSVNVAAQTTVHLFSIRPKALITALPNRAQFLPQLLTLHALTQPVIVRVIFGASFSVAPTWADADNGSLACSAYQIGTAGTYSGVGSAVTVYQILVAAGSNSQINFDTLFTVASFPPITLDRTGAVVAQRTLSFVAFALSEASTVSATLSWKELD